MQDTKSNSMRNKVLGGTPYFFALFSGRGIFKMPASYRDIYIARTKKHGFQAKSVYFRHKKSIHDDLQCYTDMM